MPVLKALQTCRDLAGIPASPLCIHNLAACTLWEYRTSVHVHADTISCGWLHTLRKKKWNSGDAVKIKQLNSPVTMSPGGGSSGKGDGPRETAGRSNYQRKREAECEEERKPWSKVKC